jgi:Family of unknown function (DUF6290)
LREVRLKDKPHCDYALGMQPSTSAFVDTEVASFSSLLEKLSGCGVSAAPGKHASRQNRQAISREDAEVADVTYKPWPVVTKPWQATRVRPAKSSSTSRESGLRGPRTSPARQQNAAVVLPDCAARDTDQEPATNIVAVGVGERGIAAPFRRAVVSIRLNDKEMTLLRQRAAESGISVSEYVRSCVVEADQLRVQVKQIVADMRCVPSVSTVGIAASDTESETLIARPRLTWLSRLIARVSGSAWSGGNRAESYEWPRLSAAGRGIQTL